MLQPALVEAVPHLRPVPTGTVLFITITALPSRPPSSSTTVQTAARSASPEYVGGVPTAT